VAEIGTSAGPIRCQMLVNAAGAHAYHVAKLAGLELPIVPVRHEYFISVPINGIRPELPAFRLPDQTLYGRPDVNGLLLGGWEPEALSLDPRGYALADPPPAIQEDWPVLSNFAELMAPFYPPAGEAGLRRVMSGWPTFTPDGRFIIGESSRVKGFVMAGGCNAHGVSGSAGIGRHLVEALNEKAPSPYVRSLSPDRFTERSWDWTEARRRFTVDDHVKATEGIECRKDEDVIDETPAAYKDIDAVMKAQEDLVEVVHTLRQIVCVKG